MTKRLLAVLIVFGLCLLHTGCEPKNPSPSQIVLNPASISIEENQPYDDYFYAAFQGTLIRYDPESGKESVTCNDPLCQHDDDSCPACLVNSHNLCVANDAVYYVREKSSLHQVLCRYDKKDGTSSEIYTIDGMIPFISAVGQYTFFITQTYDISAKSSDSIHAVTDLYRYDSREKQLSKLNTEPLADIPRYYSHTDKRIFWQDETSQDYYSTDINYQNKQAETPPQVLIRGNFAFPIQQNIGDTLKTIIFTVSRKPLQGNGETVCYPVCTSFRLLDDKFIYMPLPEKATSLGKDEMGNDYCYFHSNEIHVINLDGTNDRILCQVDNHYIHYLAELDGNPMLSENYLGISLLNIVKNEAGIITESNTSQHLLILNLKTGDYKISH